MTDAKQVNNCPRCGAESWEPTEHKPKRWACLSFENLNGTFVQFLPCEATELQADRDALLKACRAAYWCLLGTPHASRNAAYEETRRVVTEALRGRESYAADAKQG